MLTPTTQTIIDNSYDTINTNNFEKFQHDLFLTLQKDVDSNLEDLGDYNDFETTIMGLELVGQYHVDSNNQIDHIEINYIDNELVN